MPRTISVRRSAIVIQVGESPCLQSHRRLLAAGLVASIATTASAADYQIVATGTFVSKLSENIKFNGTSGTALPPILDFDRLEGGSFRATYRFNTVTPQPGATAFYDLNPTSGISYELLDSSGSVVHKSSGTYEPTAFVANNTGSAPFTVDQVVLTSFVNSVSGATIPTPLYSAQPQIAAVADLNFATYVTSSFNPLTDTGIPTSQATYQSFTTPGRSFTAIMEFGDGDYLDRVAPYQYAYAQLEYNITALTVSAVVPEPAGLSLVAGLLLLRRSRAIRQR